RRGDLLDCFPVLDFAIDVRVERKTSPLLTTAQFPVICESKKNIRPLNTPLLLKFINYEITCMITNHSAIHGVQQPGSQSLCSKNLT
ncbi:MAG: hypothetical protein ACI9KN_000307, partial [Gammaproteobacteria bacterium]